MATATVRARPWAAAVFLVSLLTAATLAVDGRRFMAASLAESKNSGVKKELLTFRKVIFSISFLPFLEEPLELHASKPI